MTTRGTKEWADSNVNCFFGCSNNCKYCYAKQMALRFKRINAPEDWSYMKPNRKAIDKNYKKRAGRIMFPTSHDITRISFLDCCTVLEKLLAAGNSVLVTTKPVPWITDEICIEFEEYKDLIQFRFTITSKDDDVLSIMEPGAPQFWDRIRALKIAHKAGYKTSVSIEPFMDERPEALVNIIQEYVTESIWIGPMNHLKGEGIPWCYYTKENLKRIHNELKDHPLIRFKDAFRNKMGD